MLCDDICKEERPDCKGGEECYKTRYCPECGAIMEDVLYCQNGCTF